MVLLELPTPFDFVLQQLQQHGLVATDRFVIAAGQGGGDVRQTLGVSNVDEGEFRTVCNPLGECRP